MTIIFYGHPFEGLWKYDTELTYVNSYTFFEEPEKDWEKIFLKKQRKEPTEPTLFDQGN